MATGSQIFSRLALVCILTLGVRAFGQALAPSAGPASSASAAKAKAPAKKTSRKTKKKTRKASQTSTQAAAAVPVAENSKVLKVIIKGNKRIETDAITTRLVSKIDEPLDREHIRQDLDALFKTGFFYDVQVNSEPVAGGVDLIYTVVEKPSVTEIVYTGNHELDNDELKEATGLKTYEILDMSKVRQAVEKIQKLYEDKGYFLARVTTKVTSIVEGDTVKLTFDVQENEKVKVKRITFLGNKSLSDQKLKGSMQTQEGGFFSFISGSGAYKQDTFDRDVQVLNYLYFNEGYVQAKVSRPQVSVTPDKKGIYITIRVDEGERFHVGTIDFSGDLLFDRDELFNSVDTKNGNWYNHETLLKDLRTLQAKYGDLGYAYANPIPRTRIREKDREIDVTFEIDKGNKVYFNRINVVGNTKTRDKVVRRELTIHEGELYNETRKRESLEAVKRLGYFEEVNFNSSIPKGSNDDLMDIDIVVKERNTGQIQVGAGYSTYSGVIFNGSVNQINLLGKGQKLGLSVEISKVQKMYNLNFTEPYFLDTKWSTGIDVYRSVRETLEYTETKTGAAVRIGHPIAPYLSGFFRYKYDITSIALPDPTSQYYAPELYPPSTANGTTSSGTVSLEYDRRDDRFAPSKGIFATTSVEYAGLGAEKDYTKGFASFRYYKKIFWGLTFRNNLTYGIISPHIASQDVPFNELFLLGGANTLRGYNWYRVGKRKKSETIKDRELCTDAGGTFTASGVQGGGSCSVAQASSPTQVAQAVQDSNQPYGGRQELYYNTEIEFPLISEAGIKGVVFYDIGEADDGVNLRDLQADYGFGFRWFSPIGPLRFEWGFPLNKVPGDSDVNFQFAIGTPF